MAAVKDLSGNSPVSTAHADRKLSSVNRAVADVDGTATPNYVGEIVTDNTLGVNYRATGTGTSDWVINNRNL